MKCKVQLFKAGTIFEEIVQATDYEDAKEVACLLYTSDAADE